MFPEPVIAQRPPLVSSIPNSLHRLLANVRSEKSSIRRLSLLLGAPECEIKRVLTQKAVKPSPSIPMIA